MSITLLAVCKCAKDDNNDYVNTTNTCLYEVMIHILFKATSLNYNCRITYQWAMMILFSYLQTVLKLLAGNEQELLHLIRFLLGSSAGSANAGNLLEGITIRNILRLVEETAYSHLMEVKYHWCLSSRSMLFQQYFTILYLISLGFRAP